MNQLKYILVVVIQTLFRMLPFPVRTGLIKVGNPGRHSPVFLTGNFQLTVERVKRALQGLDCYLLLANSRGINVWCAATGGHLTNHDVISALKVSGIEEEVDHRKIILPQLAATGIEGREIHHKTGWEVIWGPVDAADIPEFVAQEYRKTEAMRRVTFPLAQRIEMAVAWAFPISLVAVPILWFVWKSALVSVLALIWAVSLFVFLSFPLYRSLLKSSGKHVGFIFFDFGRGGIQLILWVLVMLVLSLLAVSHHSFSWQYLLRWGTASLFVVLIVSMDLTGSTPLFKSGLHEDRLLRINLDKDKCRGAGFCEQVCPVNCFEVHRELHTAFIPRADDCVQCGACIVQCPFDALYFRAPDGRVVPPETIRKYKLNLLGNRLVRV